MANDFASLVQSSQENLDEALRDLKLKKLLNTQAEKDLNEAIDRYSEAFDGLEGYLQKDVITDQLGFPAKLGKGAKKKISDEDLLDLESADLEALESESLDAIDSDSEQDYV